MQARARQLRAFAGRRTFFSCRWNKINASSLDGTLFVATSIDAKAMQRNALCSVNSQTFRGAGASVARVRWMANRYSASSQDGALCKRERGNCGRSRDGALSFRVAGTKLMRVRWTARSSLLQASTRRRCNATHCAS